MAKLNRIEIEGYCHRSLQVYIEGAPIPSLCSQSKRKECDKLKHCTLAMKKKWAKRKKDSKQKIMFQQLKYAEKVYSKCRWIKFILMEEKEGDDSFRVKFGRRVIHRK